ncbi:MAG: hypothetical protein IT479_13345 [Xanthomonadales bacterium]|nr:hypothetical protein [Xanthomonadales bacterium]
MVEWIVVVAVLAACAAYVHFTCGGQGDENRVIPANAPAVDLMAVPGIWADGEGP